jgi:hypothetical protein
VSLRARRAAWPLAFGALACVLVALAARQFGPYLERGDLDHGVHLRFVQALAAGARLLPHFGYHLLVALAAGLSTDLDELRRAAQAVLSLLVLAKLALSLGLARALLARAESRLAPAAALLLALALFFVAPLPNWWRPEDIYLGQLSPTVWHNPTVIAALPLAVASFWAFLLPVPRRARDECLAGVLLGLSVLAKPNFALAFLPAAGLLRLLGGGRLAQRLAGIAWLSVPAVLALGWQYHQAVATGLAVPGEGVLAVQPLEVWQGYSPHPLVSALVSLAFPLAVAAVVGRRARLGRALAAAWLLALVAVAQFALLAEPGPRLDDGNYYWGVVPAVYLLFLVSACELLARGGEPAAAGGGWRGSGRVARIACWAILALHVASGVWLYLQPFQIAIED